MVGHTGYIHDQMRHYPLLKLKDCGFPEEIPPKMLKDLQEMYDTWIPPERRLEILPKTQVTPYSQAELQNLPVLVNQIVTLQTLLEVLIELDKLISYSMNQH